MHIVFVWYTNKMFLMVASDSCQWKRVVFEGTYEYMIYMVPYMHKCVHNMQTIAK